MHIMHRIILRLKTSETADFMTEHVKHDTMLVYYITCHYSCFFFFFDFLPAGEKSLLGTISLQCLN